MKYVNLAINLTIVGTAVVLFSFIFLVLFSLIKFKSTKNIGLYIYSFTTATLIILGGFGFYGEAKELLESGYEHLHQDGYALSPDSAILGAVFVIGSFIGVFVTISIRYFMIKKNNSCIHHNHHDHAHNDNIFNLRDIDNPKSKWLAIWLVLSHRFLDAIAIAILLVETALTEETSEWKFPVDNLGLIISFIVHILFESIFIYHRQVEMGVSRKKALINSFVMKGLIIPIMFVAGFIFQVIGENQSDGIKWILPFMFVLSGSMLIFVAIIELVPEFMDNKDMSAKTWFLVLLFFALGISITAGLLVTFHVHPENESSNDVGGNDRDHDHTQFSKIVELIKSAKVLNWNNI